MVRTILLPFRWFHQLLRAVGNAHPGVYAFSPCDER